MAASPVQAIARASRGVFGYFVRHRTAANLILLLMLVGGYFASTEIRSQFFPDSVREVVTVTVVWPGAGPSDVDSAIVGVIAPRTLTIEGVENVYTLAREGRASIWVNFEDDWDMGRGVDEVKAAVDSIRDFPEDVDPPTVAAAVWSRPVAAIAVTGPMAPQDLKLYCEHLGRYFTRHYRQLAAEEERYGVDFRSIRFPGLISATAWVQRPAMKPTGEIVLSSWLKVSTTFARG